MIPFQTYHCAKKWSFQWKTSFFVQCTGCITKTGVPFKEHRFLKLFINACSKIRTHNRLVRKRTLNYLAKLAKYLSCAVRTYLYGAFQCMPLLTDWLYGFESHCCHLNFKVTPVSSKEFLDIRATIECRFALKRVRDMITTYTLYQSWVFLPRLFSKTNILFFPEPPHRTTEPPSTTPWTLAVSIGASR